MDKNFTNKLLRFGTSIDIVPSSIKKLNPQFSLCDIDVMYVDDNRNMTSIPKNVVVDAMYSLYGIPIVGEWLEEEQRFGDHGQTIEIKNGKIVEKVTTKPIGFVTQEAVENATFIKKTLPNGHEEKEWLHLENCILWSGRYDEAQFIIENGTSQSMEVLFEDGFYRDDGVFEASKMTFSALCAIGVEPCFEESNIRRHYELDSFKQEFTSMLDEYKKSKMEESKDMTEKVFELLSAITFKCNDADVAKYAILSISDAEANVIDKEDGYKAYTIPYSVAEGDEPEVTLDLDGKVEKSVGVMDKAEDDFSIKAEIDAATSVATANAVTEALENYESEAVKEMTEKYEKLEADFNDMKSNYESAQAKLDVFEAEKAEAERKLHEKEIDDVVESYASKMGTYADYLLYKSKVDYSKSKEQVNTDMLILLGKANMGQKSSFSFNPVVTGVGKETYFESDNGNGRYGDLFEKLNK